MNVYFIAFIVALGVTYLATPSVKRLAIRWGAVDKPDARKVHKGIIPRLGGLAIYAGFIASVLASVHLTWELVGLLTGGTAILLLGVLDDIYQLPAKVKLAGQIVAASVLLLFDIQIDWLTNPFGSMIYLDMWAIPFTLLWVVSLTNMLNLIDGLDGLAAGVSTIAAVTVFSDGGAAESVAGCRVDRRTGRQCARFSPFQLQPGKNLHGGHRQHVPGVHVGGGFGRGHCQECGDHCAHCAHGGVGIADYGYGLRDYPAIHEWSADL